MRLRTVWLPAPGGRLKALLRTRFAGQAKIKPGALGSPILHLSLQSQSRVGNFQTTRAGVKPNAIGSAQKVEWTAFRPQTSLVRPI